MFIILTITGVTREWVERWSNTKSPKPLIQELTPVVKKQNKRRILKRIVIRVLFLYSDPSSNSVPVEELHKDQHRGDQCGPLER